MEAITLAMGSEAREAVEVDRGSRRSQLERITTSFLVSNETPQSKKSPKSSRS